MIRLHMLTHESFPLTGEPICLTDEMPNLARESFCLIAEPPQPHR